MFEGTNARRAPRYAPRYATACAALMFATAAFGASEADPVLMWMKIKADTKAERSELANRGVSIEAMRDGFVFATGSKEQRDRLAGEGRLETSYRIDPNALDFPGSDSNFHDYARMTSALQELARANPDIVSLDSIGETYEKRSMWHLRISTDLAHADAKPGAIIMGGHHAREHVSMEIPLLLAQKLVDGYRSGDAEIKRLVEGRDIHIIPMVNADGADYDVASGSYRMWRKNRSPQGRAYGVDLNRNYGYKWGTGGSSADPRDETYKGPAPFSEPETQAMKRFIDSRPNATVLLTLHTFSELVLYPWGYTDDAIPATRDHAVFEKMAKTMAAWNGYTPEQTSELYIASGDTTDWAYAEHKIFAFTFELDPRSMWSGGFYPGQDVIQPVFQKNLKPMLYMIDLADDPYRAIESSGEAYGVPSLPIR